MSDTHADAQHATRVLKSKAFRERAVADPTQVDLEEVTGVAAEQAERETEVGGIAADRLRSIVERIEKLEEERKELAENIKDIFTEGKSAGFDVKVLRQILAIRKKEPAEVEEMETLLDLYRRALNM